MDEFFLVYPKNIDVVRGSKKNPASLKNLFYAIIIIAIFCIAGLIWVGISYKYSNEYIKLKFSGATASGQYVSHRKDTGGDNTEYYLRYKFAVDRVIYENEKKVDHELYSKFTKNSHPGDEALTVYYYTKNPDISDIENPNIAKLMILFLTTIIWHIAFYGILIYLINKRSKLIKLSQSGKIIDGKLINCNGYYDEGDFYIKGEYNFKSPYSYNLIHGKYNNISRDDLKNKTLPGIGAPVKILYLDDNIFEIL